MKIKELILITLFFTTLLEASYLRSIRVGAFESEIQAQRELATLNGLVANHTNILNLQKTNTFKFKYRKTGGYYVTVVEPFRDKAVLQEVLDTLRVYYKDIYVTRIREKKVVPKKVQPKPIVVQEKTIAQELMEIPEVVAEKIKLIEVRKTKNEDPKIEPKVESKAEPLEYPFEKKVNTVEVNEENISSDINIYEIAFYIALLLILILVYFLLNSKRKNNTCKDREYETNKIFNKKDIEIKHKDSFLSHAKTSVATIHNFTNLLLEFELTVIQKDYVQRIRSSSEYLLNTVNNTLDITKLRNDTLKIEYAEFDINEMLKKVAKIISLEAKNKNLEFDLVVENDVPAYIFGDPTRIRQVLITLLGNSVKFTKEGKITLTVKTLYNYTHAVSIGFIIADTGIGMSEEQVSDIHDSSTEIIDGGTVGLGLSVTKQLIEMMHGEIKIYSTEDVGTTFTFSLKFGLKR